MSNTSAQAHTHTHTIEKERQTSTHFSKILTTEVGFCQRTLQLLKKN